MKYCKCGCGQVVTSETAMFIRWHHINLQRGKSYEEIYGKEKSIKLKRNLNQKNKNKTYEEIHGDKKALLIKKKQSLKHKGICLGKTWEERYGKEKSQKIKNKVLFKTKKKKPFNKKDYEKRKISRKENHKYLLEYAQEWRKNHKQHSKKYRQLKRKNNIEIRILENIRARIRKAIKQQQTKKSNKTIKLIGCTINELKQHLEKQFKPKMTWDNNTRTGWHIDHIIPCTLFDLTNKEEQLKCFHYTNLQPLWAKENLGKNNKAILNKLRSLKELSSLQ